MILGDVFARGDAGSAPPKRGKTTPTDYAEPQKVARSSLLMGLKHAVITSSTPQTTFQTAEPLSGPPRLKPSGKKIPKQP